MSCLRPPVATGMEPGWEYGYCSPPCGSGYTPSYPVVPASTQATAWSEPINFQIPQGIQVLTIPFSVIKASGNIYISGAVIENLVDASPIVPSFDITNRTITGLEVTLSTPIDSDNYYFRGFAFVVT